MKSTRNTKKTKVSSNNSTKKRINENNENIMNNTLNISKRNKKLKNVELSNDSVITLFIMGHGADIYDINKRFDNKNFMGDEEIYKFINSDMYNDKYNVRILSKTGAPFVCGWTKSSCITDPSLNSAIMLLEVAKKIFQNNKNISTFDLLNILSNEYKEVYKKELLSIDPSKIDPSTLHLLKESVESVKGDQFSIIKKPVYDKIYTVKKNIDTNECVKYGIYIIDSRNTPYLYDDVINNEINISEDYNNLDNEKKNEVDHYFDLFNNNINNDNIISENYKNICYSILHDLKYNDTINLIDLIVLFRLIGFNSINIIDDTCRTPYDYDSNIGFNVNIYPHGRRAASIITREEAIKHNYKDNRGGNIKTKNKKSIKRYTKKSSKLYENNKYQSIMTHKLTYKDT